jgi:hypothetical protein
MWIKPARFLFSMGLAALLSGCDGNVVGPQAMFREVLLEDPDAIGVRPPGTAVTPEDLYNYTYLRR